jgi:hypothetical protein
MTTTTTQTLTLLQHLRTPSAPFRLRRTVPAELWADAAIHEEGYRLSPERYALCAVAREARPEQRARVLFQLLAGSRRGLSDQVRQTLDRVAGWLLRVLAPEQVLTVFLALRRIRANHKHTARAILRYLLNHPQIEDLARLRRPSVVDSLEHALGKNTFRGACKSLADAEASEVLLKYAADKARATAVLAYLAGQGLCPESRHPGEGLVALEAAPTVAPRERPRTITATNRGDIAATLVHIYQGGANVDLKSALGDYVEQAAAELPRFAGSVALVLDASASTRGYGEREFCVISQSEALRLVLEKCCANLRVFPESAGTELPLPEGDTDLALALLDAVQTDPALVVIVSDGYENVAPGDLARVVASLPAVGVETPVVFCHSQFTDKDDLTWRRPAPALPELEFWHQQDFADLLWSLFSRARAPHGEAFLEGQLRRQLALA